MKRRDNTRVLPASIALMMVLALGVPACSFQTSDRTASSPSHESAAVATSTATVSTRQAASTMANQVAAQPPHEAPLAYATDTGAGSLTGRTVYLDPGHAGTAPPQDLLVTDGRGGLKPCNTSGTASNDGFPEHEFNWLMAQEIKSLLEQRGATVLLSRSDDTGRADCIDARAEKENASGADAVVSLHADGAGEGNRGFHVSSIDAPMAANDAGGSAKLAEALRDALVRSGIATSNYLGVDGLNPRADLTGLNLSTRPKALIEYGNMRDSADIALLASEDGRRRLAEATVAGIEVFLGA